MNVTINLCSYMHVCANIELSLIVEDLKVYCDHFTDQTRSSDFLRSRLLGVMNAVESTVESIASQRSLDAI